MDYTLDQIRAAFWATFHKEGEIWFCYLGSEDENEESTVNHWQAFKEQLEKQLCP